MLKKDMSKKWKYRTGKLDNDEAGATVDKTIVGLAFENLNGTLDIDTTLNIEFGTKCPFGNIDINNVFNSE